MPPTCSGENGLQFVSLNPHAGQQHVSSRRSEKGIHFRKQFLKQPFLNDKSYLREGTKSTSVGEERLGSLSLSDPIQTSQKNIPFKLAQNVSIIAQYQDTCMRIQGTLFDEPSTCQNYELRLPPILIMKKILQLKSEKINHLRQGLDCISVECWRHGAPQCEHISHLLGSWDHEYRGLNL